VVRRGPHERQAQRDIDAAGEVHRLDRDQRLVVIHAEDRIVGGARRGMEQRVGGRGPPRIDAVALQHLDRRRDHAAFLVAHRALLAGVGIEGRHREPRTFDAEQGLQSCRRQATSPHDLVSV
jgi:hypothetical protein